jgi:Mg2+/Co2+ transporter CorB
VCVQAGNQLLLRPEALLQHLLLCWTVAAAVVSTELIEFKTALGCSIATAAAAAALLIIAATHALTQVAASYCCVLTAASMQYLLRHLASVPLR